MSTSRPSIHPRITSFSLQHYYNQTPTSLLCTYFSLRHTLALRPRIPPPPFFSTMSLSRSTFNDFLLLLNFFYFFTYSFYTSIFWRALHYGTTFRSFPFPLYIHNQGTLSHSADLSSRSYSLCRPTVSGVPVSSCSLVPRRVGINRGGAVMHSIVHACWFFTLLGCCFLRRSVGVFPFVLSLWMDVGEGCTY